MKEEKKKLVSEKLRILKMEIDDIVGEATHKVEVIQKHIDLILRDLKDPSGDDWGNQNLNITYEI